jgi:hypothetical protein
MAACIDDSLGVAPASLTSTVDTGRRKWKPGRQAPLQTVQLKCGAMR